LLVAGRALRAPDEVMVGKIAADAAGWKVGDTVQFFNDPVARTLFFRIVGIFSTDVPWESAGAVVHARIIQERLHAGEDHSLAFLYLAPGADPRAVRDDLNARYGELTVEFGERILDQFNQLEYVDQFLWIVSTVAVLVGGLGILNTLMMSISERTREIGMLRAIGWSRRAVLGTILAEGLVLSVVGGVLGLGLGVAAAEALLAWYPSGLLVASYTAPTFARAFAIAVVLGGLGALYPAWRASRLSPAVAVRYE
jgi:putative ABC transport system permease protein